MNKIQKTKFIEEKADGLGVSLEDYEWLLDGKIALLNKIIYGIDEDIQDRVRKDIFSSRDSFTKYGKHVALLAYGMGWFSMYFIDENQRKAVLDEVSDKGDKPVRLAYVAYLAYHEFGEDSLIYRLVEGSYLYVRNSMFSKNRHDNQVGGSIHEKMVKIYDGIEKMDLFYKSNSPRMRLDLDGMPKPEPVILF